MFFKKVKNIIVTFIVMLSMMPMLVLAYSDYIIPGGETIGITLNTKGVLVVGLYKAGDKYPGQDANIKTGDSIISINNTEVNRVSEMVAAINSSSNKDEITIQYEREGITYQTTLKLVQNNDGVYQTGLYVKDSLSGLGTLTFIDPGTNLYGALGHEIAEKNTGLKLEIKNGTIYGSEVTSITKSNSGVPGEKNATFDSGNIKGTIDKNAYQGLFGIYTAELPSREALKVASKNEVKKGRAQMLTVLEGTKIEMFDINITNINMNGTVKNIVFEIIDPVLLSKTGGVVQGMSGSPIIQDNKIIGAVTHVVVDNPVRGYGIFITNMLEEAES